MMLIRGNKTNHIMTLTSDGTSVSFYIDAELAKSFLGNPVRLVKVGLEAFNTSFEWPEEYKGFITKIKAIKATEPINLRIEVGTRKSKQIV